MRSALLSLLLATSVVAGPAEEVRDAELLFAKKFVERDSDGFLAMVADDAVFFNGRVNMIGRTAVGEGWKRLLESPRPYMTWGPDRVVTNAAGTLGLSYGPVYEHATGKHIGHYSTTWQKGKDGRWRALFDSPGAPPPVVEVEEGFVAAHDGAKLFYRKMGQGRLTLIVPLDFMLHEEVRQFADVATIITYDPRNRGRSSRVEDVKLLTIENDLRDLESIRAHFKVDQFIPIGYSYLGKLVAMYALRHPQHVARFVQIGPVPMRTLPGPEYDRAALGVPDELAQRRREQPDDCEAQWNVLKYVIVGSPAHVTRVDPLVKATCALENEWPVHFNRHLAAHGPTVMGTLLSDEEVKRLTMPVLTIHGTRDRNAPFAGGEQWRRTLPNARLVRVEGAAHNAWSDDPVAVWTAVRQFLRGETPFGSE